MAKGGDILHTVVVNGKAAGLVLYECKRCRRIATDHIEQEARDKRTRQADFAIVVTASTRRGFRGLAHEGSVLLVSPPAVIALATLLRAQLIQMERVRLTKSQGERIAASALDYLTSPVFRVPLEDAIAKTRRARSLLQREVKAHVIMWRHRWALYQTVDLDLQSITANTERVLQGGKPVPIGRIRPIPLQLPAANPGR